MMNDKKYSKKNEKAVLGAILKDEKVLKDVQEIISVDDYYYEKHKIIYSAMEELKSSSISIDTVTLTNHLKKLGKIKQVGGAYEITQLCDNCPTTANVKTYAKYIRDNAIDRIKDNLIYKMSKGNDKASDELLELLKSEPTINEFSQSDAGNAELLVHLYGDKIRYNHTEKRWYIWNGYYWKPDENNSIYELAKQSAKYRQKQAISIADSTKKQIEMRYAIKSEDYNKIVACVNSAKTIEKVSTISNEWDNDPLLLQCENGILKLEEKVQFGKAEPNDMISKSTQLEYDKNALCKLWKRAVLEIFSNDKEMVEYFQRCVGYTLTGHTKEQKFFLLYGIGANGKSIIFEILRDLLGDYAINTRFDTFEIKYNKQSNEIARLHQYRLVTASESGDAKKLDSELLKAITGGDKVTCRFLYNESFDYTPKFKIWFASNSLPSVEDTSLGFWRRVQLIELKEVFTGANADLDLVHKLKKELSGILNWALEGYEMYLKIGLNPPAKIENAKDEYRSDSDIVRRFTDELLISKKEGVITAKNLYQRFKDWYDANYLGALISQIKFGKRMKEIGFTSTKIGGTQKYIGIALTEE